MKKAYWILIMILFSIFALAEDRSDTRLITVTGNAEVRVVPGQLNINARVTVSFELK